MKLYEMTVAVQVYAESKESAWEIVADEFVSACNGDNSIVAFGVLDDVEEVEQ